MNEKGDWKGKLDPQSRLILDEGLPPAGADVTVRLSGPDPAAATQVERAGLQVHAQVGEIIVGRVTGPGQLKDIAELPCVHEVQMSRPLFEDRPRPTELESDNERGEA